MLLHYRYSHTLYTHAIRESVRVHMNGRQCELSVISKEGKKKQAVLIALARGSPKQPVWAMCRLQEIPNHLHILFHWLSYDLSDPDL